MVCIYVLPLMVMTTVASIHNIILIQVEYFVIFSQCHSSLTRHSMLRQMTAVAMISLSSLEMATATEMVIRQYTSTCEFFYSISIEAYFFAFFYSMTSITLCKHKPIQVLCGILMV